LKRVFLSLLFGLLVASCGTRTPADDEAFWTRERGDMVEVLRRHSIQDTRILAAMGKIRRHLFIPAPHRAHGTAYGNHPWPIGHDQTISQPFIVAYMTEKLGLQSGEKVMEIGTGSGYQAAVLSELGARVYTIEIIPELADHARNVLASEGYAKSVQVLTGDGYKGWPAQAPFDAIIVTCAPQDLPKPLVDQLREGGRMILPLGDSWASQRLVILRKTAGQVRQTDDLPVRFVPMVQGK
jgi:protein-L-isoaspartate(D-aspartate) O-methyltransferase